MDTQDMVKRAAWQAGVSEDLADRVIEAFLHELRESIARGEAVDLGRFGAFIGASFRPGWYEGRPASALADAEAYEAGTAPSDS